MTVQTKKSKIVKNIYLCDSCGSETEVVNSDVPPAACLECGSTKVRQTARMGVDMTVVVTQLPFGGK